MTPERDTWKYDEVEVFFNCSFFKYDFQILVNLLTDNNWLTITGFWAKNANYFQPSSDELPLDVQIVWNFQETLKTKFKTQKKLGWHYIYKYSP